MHAHPIEETQCFQYYTWRHTQLLLRRQSHGTHSYHCADGPISKSMCLKLCTFLIFKIHFVMSFHVFQYFAN